MTYAIAMLPTAAAKCATYLTIADVPLVGVSPPAVTEALIDVARRLYALRKVRDELLGDALFSEPAWNMLLDLFISGYERRRLSVSAVCIGARAPSATALRYLTMLQDADLVERTRDERDARRSHVQLTALGQRRMVALLSRL
ncbi:winged helix DNA-binding protein [Sphingomonas faeni]|uniref:winged helix DNA-binding protein n=1 Tax=Sphingomonas faeni TaxID=185950 RepID=UPI0020C7484F|nr:winged helix DNA-binding protein [Sphingomonas faeni]MCP8889130.1 winged helix DNA-binding protein [Sphingomonas faeni]